MVLKKVIKKVTRPFRSKESLLKEAKDLPAVTPNLMDESKLIGSIFYLPSDIVGRLARNSNVFSRVFTLACNFTI